MEWRSPTKQNGGKIYDQEVDVLNRADVIKVQNTEDDVKVWNRTDFNI